MKFPKREWETRGKNESSKFEWIWRFSTLRLKMLENHVSRRDAFYLLERKREKLSMANPLVIRSALLTNLTKFCVLEFKPSWSCKESLVREDQRVFHLLDKREVRTTSLVERKNASYHLLENVFFTCICNFDDFVTRFVSCVEDCDS
jgi:hypothetical protein